MTAEYSYMGKREQFTIMILVKRLGIIVIITLLCSELHFSLVWADYTSFIEAFEYNGVQIPASKSDAFVIINNNKPFFTEAEKSVTNTYESYSEYDSLNRVGIVQANIDKSSLNINEREDISSVQPTGWLQNKYDIVSGGWLYNRSHLYAHSLGGDDIAKNLMTGTRAFNVDGMYTSSEAIILNYIKASKSNIHVLYRVTPLFSDNDLLSKGVLIEAQCLENPEFSICSFCYNTQPGISIDYSTGANILATDNNNEQNEKPQLKSLSKLTINSPKSMTYTGRALKPSIKIQDGSTTLTLDNDYTVQYMKNLLPGKARIKVSGIGNYQGNVYLSFIIRPSRVKIIALNNSKRSVTIKWKKHKCVTGYQITYRIKGKRAKTFNCRSKKVKATIRKLKSKKYCTIKIRAYKQVNGKKYYGPYSKIRTRVT